MLDVGCVKWLLFCTAFYSQGSDSECRWRGGGGGGGGGHNSMVSGSDHDNSSLQVFQLIARYLTGVF